MLYEFELPDGEIVEADFPMKSAPALGKAVRLPDGRTGVRTISIGSIPKASGEFWRGHKHLALLIGKKEVPKFEAFYRRHGVNVTHRKTASGDYEPQVTRREQFNKLLAARGLVDRG
jgi:hypothetical protein